MGLTSGLESHDDRVAELKGLLIKSPAKTPKVWGFQISSLLF